MSQLKLFEALNNEFFNFPAISSYHPVFREKTDFFAKPSNMPSPDIVDYDNRVDLSIPLAGYKKEDVEVVVEEGNLVVNVNKRETYSDEKDKPNFFYKRGISLSGFNWKLKLNSTIDIDNMKAKLEDGMLYITLPKKEKVVKRLEISD